MWRIDNYKEIYARYEASGLSAIDFCMNEGITRSRFYYWLKKYRKLQGLTLSCIKSDAGFGSYGPSAGFIPLPVAGELQKSKTADSVKASVDKPASRHWSGVSDPYMEIAYPNGTRVRLMGEKDMELVKVLMDRLR
jgi:hypothetical protein